MISTDISIGVIQELYNRMTLFGYDIEEFRVDTNRGVIEIIQSNGRPMDSKMFVNLLESDVMWVKIRNHVMKMDNGTVNVKLLERLRQGIVKRKVKVYSSTIGTGSLGIGIAFSQNPEWLTYLGSPEGRLDIAGATLFLIMAGYTFVLNWDSKVNGKTNA